MAKQEESNERQLQRQETKTNIIPHIEEIRKLTESLTSLLSREPFGETDLDSAFDLNDAIQERTEEINALLFELRDRIG